VRRGLGWLGAGLMVVLVGLTDAAGATTVVAPVSLNHHRGVDLASIACPLERQCTAVGAHGLAVTFDPVSPGSPTPTTIDRRGALESVFCPSTSQCTAVDDQGWEITFDPANPRTRTASRIFTASTPLAVACPSTQQCSAVGTRGLEVAFNPSSPHGAATTKLDSYNGAKNLLTAVACPSLHLCIAIHTSGLAISYDPANPRSRESSQVGASHQLLSISCASASACAIGGGSADVTAIVPSSLAVAGPSYLVESPGPGPLGNTGRLVGISCPGATQCTVVDNSGYEITINPLNPGFQEESAPRTTIDTNPLTSVACPSATQCTALDNEGREVTFNPL